MRTPEECADALIGYINDRGNTAGLRPYLVAMLRAYSDERAAEMRERCAQQVDRALAEMVQRGDDERKARPRSKLAGQYYDAVCFHLHQLAAAIRAPSTAESPSATP